MITPRQRSTPHAHAPARNAELPRLEWRCEQCGQPVDDGAGYITVNYHAIFAYEHAAEAWERKHKPPTLWTPLNLNTLQEYPELVRWRILHRACDPEIESVDYWIRIERVRTHADLLARTAHLLETKSWLQSTNWAEFIAAQAHATPSAEAA
jgi:hypothetical protein